MKPKYRPGDILTDTSGNQVEIVAVLGTTAAGFHYLGPILYALNDRSMWTEPVAQVDAMFLDVLTRAERLHRALERKAEAERDNLPTSQIDRQIAYLEGLEGLESLAPDQHNGEPAT